MSTIANLVAKLGLDATEYDRSAARVEKRTRGLGTVLSSALGSAIGFAGATLGLRVLDKGIDAVRGGVIGMNAALETSTLQFETLMGSADKARAHVAMLFTFAKRTPFETGPIIEASRTLETFGKAALNTRDTLTMIGDAAAATSQPIQELSFWTGRLYSSIMSGRPAGEALMRLQELSVLSGEARNRIEALQESGASGAEIWAVYTQELERFKGAMERQQNTWEGLTSTAQDSMGILSAKAFAPFFKFAKDGLKAFNEFLDRPDVEQWAYRVNAGFQVVLRGLSVLARGFASTFGSILRIVSSVGGAIYRGLMLLSPFTRHSPSLVEQVDAGLAEIERRYNALPSRISAAIGKAGDLMGALKQAAASGLARGESMQWAEDARALALLGDDVPGAYKTAADAVRELEIAAEDLARKMEEQESALEAQEDVLEGLERAADAAETKVRGFRDQIQAARDTLVPFEDALRDAEYAFSGIEEQISKAEDALRSFTRAPLEGEGAFADMIAANELEAKKLQMAISRLRSTDAPAVGLEALERQLEAVREQGEVLRLQRDIAYEPLHRELDKIADTSKEISFQEAFAGAREARATIDRLSGPLAEAKTRVEETSAAYRAQKELVDAQVRAIEPLLRAAEEQARIATEAVEKQRSVVEEHRTALEETRAKYEEITSEASAWREQLNGILATANQIASIDAGAGAGGGAGIEDPMAALSLDPAGAVDASIAEVERLVDGWSGALDRLEKRVTDFQTFMDDVAGGFETGNWAKVARSLGLLTGQNPWEKPVAYDADTAQAQYIADTMPNPASQLPEGVLAAGAAGPAGQSAASLAPETVLPPEWVSGGEFARLITEAIRNQMKEVDWESLGSDLRDGVGRMLAGALSGIGADDPAITGDWGRNLGLLLGKVLTGVLSLAIATLNAPFDLLGALVGWIFGDKEAMEGIDKNPVLNFLKGLFGGIAEELLPWLGDHWFDVLMGAVTLAFVPAKLIGGVFGVIAKALGKIPVLGKALGPIGEAMAKGLEGISKALHTLNPFEEVGARLWKGLLDALDKKKTEVMKGVGEWFDEAILGGIRKLLGIGKGGGKPTGAGPMQEIGDGISYGIEEGLYANEPWVHRSVGEWALEAIIGGIKSALGIKSPSTVAALLGADVAAGLERGMRGYQFDLAAWLNVDIVGSIQSWLDTSGAAALAQQGQDIGSEIGRGLGDKLGEIGRGVGDWLGGIGQQVDSWRSGITAPAAPPRTALPDRMDYPAPAISGRSGGALYTDPLFENASGGLYKVAGFGGIDSQLVSFWATPGEVVAVAPEAAGAVGGGGGGPIEFNAPLVGQMIVRNDEDRRAVIVGFREALLEALAVAEAQGHRSDH